MTKAQSYLEKRTHPRVPIKVPVQYQCVDDSVEMEKLRGSTGLAKDLSLDGLYLKTYHLFNVGDVFKLEITIPEPFQQLFAYAEVVWAKQGSWFTKNSAGLRLMLMPVEDKEALKAYFNRIASQS